MKSPVHAALLAGSSLWCAGIITGPLGDIRSIYDFFAAICHQDPERSWFLFGTPLPVCIRCASIYFSFLGSLWIGLPGRVTWLRVAIITIITEFLFAALVIDLAILRSLSGILLGATAAPFVSEGIQQMLARTHSGGADVRM